MREHKFPYESFIAGWYIDPQICDDLIDLFNDNKKHHNVGVSGGPYNVQKNVKDSIDLGLHPDWDEPRFVAYKNALKECVGLYEKLYPEVKGFNNREVILVLLFLEIRASVCSFPTIREHFTKVR